MPGLRLTTSQARRLWGLDSETCVWLLTNLVEACFLSPTSSGLLHDVMRPPGRPPLSPERIAAAVASRATNKATSKRSIAHAPWCRCGRTFSRAVLHVPRMGASPDET